MNYFELAKTNQKDLDSFVKVNSLPLKYYLSSDDNMYEIPKITELASIKCSFQNIILGISCSASGFFSNSKTKQKEIFSNINGVKRWMEILIQRYDLTNKKIILCVTSASHWIYTYTVKNNASLIDALNNDLYHIPCQRLGNDWAHTFKMIMPYLSKGNGKNLLLWTRDSFVTLPVKVEINELVNDNFVSIVIDSSECHYSSPIEIKIEGIHFENKNEFITKVTKFANDIPELRLSVEKICNEHTKKKSEQDCSKNEIYTHTRENCADLCVMANAAFDLLLGAGVIFEDYTQKYFCEVNGAPIPYDDKIQKYLLQNKPVLCYLPYGQYLVVPGKDSIQIAVKYNHLRSPIPIEFDQLPYGFGPNREMVANSEGIYKIKIDSNLEEFGIGEFALDVLFVLGEDNRTKVRNVVLKSL